MQSDIYDMEVTEMTEWGARTYSVPCYTCGHCSNIIALRPDRYRERKSCYVCGRLICEKSEICNTHCTPIHKLAANGDMGNPTFGKYIPAIMQGVDSVTEATEKGLINVKEN